MKLPAKKSSQPERDERTSPGVGTRRRRSAERESSVTGWQARSEALGLPLSEAELDRVRVALATVAELAKHRFCLAGEGGGVCHLDAGHKPPHMARVGERIDTPRGPRRQIITWGAK